MQGCRCDITHRPPVRAGSVFPLCLRAGHIGLHPAIAAILLGLIHGQVGGLEQFGGGVAIAGQVGDANAGADLMLPGGVSTGWRRLTRSWSASASTVLRLCGGGSSSTNSSPPSRATVSIGPAQACSRRATSCSSRSPASWPQRSLTGLKWSRSISSSAPSPWRSLAWLSA